MLCLVQVAGLRWEHKGEPKEVRDVVQRFIAHVRSLHLGPVDCHTVHLLGALPLQPLRALSVQTVTRGSGSRFWEPSADGE